VRFLSSNVNYDLCSTRHYSVIVSEGIKTNNMCILTIRICSSNMSWMNSKGVCHKYLIILLYRQRYYSLNCRIYITLLISRVNMVILKGNPLIWLDNMISLINIISYTRQGMTRVKALKHYFTGMSKWYLLGLLNWSTMLIRLNSLPTWVQINILTPDYIAIEGKITSTTVVIILLKPRNPSLNKALLDKLAKEKVTIENR